MKVLIAALALVLLAVNVSAEELTFQWDTYTDNAEGFRIYMDSSDVIVANNIPVGDIEATLTADLNGSCKNFWIRAYAGDLLSAMSNIVVACPPTGSDPPPATQPPVAVGGFQVEVRVTPL